MQNVSVGQRLRTGHPVEGGPKGQDSKGHDVLHGLCGNQIFLEIFGGRVKDYFAQK